MFSGSRFNKTLPATRNALVVRHFIIDETAAYVVLGWIGFLYRHAPNDYSDAIAGIADWAFSLHVDKLLRVTDKSEPS